MWQGSDYYINRVIETFLLAPIKCSEKDLDACLHRCPLDPGTRGGMQLIFPSVSSLLSHHEGIRMLQCRGEAICG